MSGVLRRTRLGLCFRVITALAAFSRAEQFAMGAEPNPVDRLIARLGSEDPAERDAASKSLDAVGEPALPALHKAARNPDPEVRRRAQMLIETIAARQHVRARIKALNDPNSSTVSVA